jgi:hypothetical protein
LVPSLPVVTSCRYELEIAVSPSTSVTVFITQWRTLGKLARVVLNCSVNFLTHLTRE